MAHPNIVVNAYSIAAAEGYATATIMTSPAKMIPPAPISSTIGISRITCLPPRSCGFIPAPIAAVAVAEAATMSRFSNFPVESSTRNVARAMMKVPPTVVTAPFIILCLAVVLFQLNLQSSVHRTSTLKRGVVNLRQHSDEKVLTPTYGDFRHSY